MIVITGGIASGKTTFLKDCDIDSKSVFDARSSATSTETFERANVVLHVEELVRREGLSEDALQTLLSKQAVTYTEVGSGVIPLAPEERQFRERAGSLSSTLASTADCVVRMVCGIPVVLKGTLPETSAKCN